MSKYLATSLFLARALAQQVGTNTPEVHPKLTTQTCTRSGCTNSQNSVVLDANWRWVHTTTGYTNCYTGNTWDTSLCPNNQACAQNCALDGADYPGTYGVTANGNALTLKLKTGSNVGSRLYLLDSSDSKYQVFKLKNKEFTFDVDVSQLGCGLNGALYFVDMDADGGVAKQANNKAGAKYGTGYCDAQCPKDLKFIGGQANVEGWTGASNNANTGTGSHGSCCPEMDIWEANNVATAYTPHPCATLGQSTCTGSTCTSTCDQAGCDFNSYRLGNQSFYGSGKLLDTKQKLTVVTQFKTADNTATGALSEIRRIYVQNGRVVQNSQVNIPGITGNSITQNFCNAQKSVFKDSNDFTTKGGLTGMGRAMDDGMVLVMSLWDDYAANMLWLDSNYPVGGNPSQPGVVRGNCPTDSGKPTDVESQQSNAQVTYSNIKFGDLDTTYTR